MILTKQQTRQNKTKRVLKYILVLFASIIVSSFLDATFDRFTDSPWLDFKQDWKVLYGAMIYRLVSTWNYDNSKLQH